MKMRVLLVVLALGVVASVAMLMTRPAGPSGFEISKPPVPSSDINGADSSVAPASAGEAQLRKLASETTLAAAGVPITAALPVIATVAEARLRPREEVTHRALALLVVAAKARGVRPQVIERLVRLHRLEGRLTPTEQAYLANTASSAAENTQYAWNTEAACTLLWSLQLINSMPAPATECNLNEANFDMETTSTEVIMAGSLRPAGQILDQADLAYRADHASAPARFNGLTAGPGGIHSEVAHRRWQAFAWLIGSQQSWQ